MELNMNISGKRKFEKAFGFATSNHLISILTGLLIWGVSCRPEASFREEIGPAGNEYITLSDPARDDSDQILTEYGQFPDSVKAVIEQILPGDAEIEISHWGPFRYTVDKIYADGHSNKLYIYLTGDVLKNLYTDGDYKERPGRLFVS